MAVLGSADDMTDEQKTILEFVLKCWDASDKLHKGYRDRWNLYYGLSRNYRKLKHDYNNASPRDRDTLMEEFRRVFGQELFIPYIFTVIETIVPRVFATDPAISVKPNNPDDATFEACEPVKRRFEKDAQISSQALRHQETVRSGLRYGLGVQKLWWESKYRSGYQIKPMASQEGFKVEDNERILVFEGPQNLSVDIFDFRWDNNGYDLSSCGYVVHRTFRTMEYIKDRVAEGKERRDQGQEGGWSELDLEKIEGMGSKTARGEVWADRMEAAGMSSFDTSGNELHEVLEYHDRDKIFTILDKQLLVQEGTNPFMHGDFPFQIYRPTLVEHEFVGIGEAEPIAHLQYELNTMRGQRRDAATLAMNRGYFYSRGMLNPKNVVTGIGAFVPVDGDPKEVISPMPFTDLPASGVEEEQALKTDIEMTTGISEATIGSSGEATATGTQLVQAAANQRIKQKVKNFHNDLLVPETCQKLELYRQHVVTSSQTQSIRVDGSDTPGGQPGEGYSFVKVGPEQFHADIEVAPVDGSTEAENEAQKRADAVQLVDALSPFMEQLEPAAVAKRVLQMSGVDHPETMLKPPGPSVEDLVTALGKTLQAQGMPEEEIHALLEQVYQQLQAPPELDTGPGGSEAPPAESKNGSAPEPEPEPEPTPVGGPA